MLHTKYIYFLLKTQHLSVFGAFSGIRGTKKKMTDILFTRLNAAADASRAISL